VNTDGTFLLEVASSSDTPWMRQVGIGIAIDGQQAVGAWAQAEIGKTTPFDLVLPSVPLVRGRVLDPDGRPVAGLRLRHTDRGANRIRVSLSDLPVEREMARNSTSFARTVTDAEGRFALHLVDRDVHDGSLFVPSGFLSESAEWFLDDPRETLVRLGVMPRLPREEIALVARPALALTGRVVDAASGEPVAAFESHAHRAGTTDYVAFDGTEGRLGLCWPRWWEADEGGQVDLSLEAKG
jgi:hypothetical protein